MNKDERTIFFYDLNIEAHARTFKAQKTISVRRAFELMRLIPVEKRKLSIAKDKQLLYIADFDLNDSDIISVLVNKSDKGVSDPVFTVPEEGKRRTAEKEEKEGQDFSAHMAIKANQDALDSALVAVEHCPGLGIHIIERLFNHLIKEAKSISPSDFLQNHPDGALESNGKPKQVSIRYKCNFEGHISEELQKDLDNGKVQSIELITEKEKFTPFDEDGYIKEKHKSIFLTLKDEEHPVKDKFKRISNVFNKNKNKYPKARIKFKTDADVPHTIDIDAIEGLSHGYVKKVKIESDGEDFQSSYGEFNSLILGKMKGLVT